MRSMLAFAMALTFVVASGGGGTNRLVEAEQQPEAPNFKIEILGYIVADFSSRVQNYFDLRTKLEIGLPALVVTEDPREIAIAEVALARRIRVAREEATRGDIFTPAISVELKKLLQFAMNATTWAALMDDNPGEFSHHVNGNYSKRKALSTVPPSILAVLPTLPDDIEYRFIGRDLILRDTRANVILDWIPDAIRCADCKESS
jgi:hypothetical protein